MKKRIKLSTPALVNHDGMRAQLSAFVNLESRPSDGLCTAVNVNDKDVTLRQVEEAIAAHDLSFVTPERRAHARCAGLHAKIKRDGWGSLTAEEQSFYQVHIGEMVAGFGLPPSTP